jgi:thioredoxin-like negative regulator of GroEL
VEWSDPCTRLTPILEDMTADADGRWKLAKINCDTLPDIATSMRVSNLPTVYFIAEGKG